MNDSRYRGPSRQPGRTSLSDYGRTQDEREPEFEEEYPYRASRSPRAGGDDGERRSGRGPFDGGPPPGRRSSRPPESGSGDDRRPMRNPRPSGMNPGAPPQRGPRDPEAMERQGRPSRRDQGREPFQGSRSDPGWEGRPRPRSGPEWGREPSSSADIERRPRRRRSNPEWGGEAAPRSGAGWEAEPDRRRSSRKQGKRRAQKAPLDPQAKRQRLFRYLGLLGIMLFAGLAGVCINYGLVLPAVPLVLVAFGCAGVFVYF